MSEVAIEVSAVGLTKRLNDFFGRKPGESAQEFMAELKALTPDDRQWFVNEFNRMGMPTVLVATK